MAYLSKNNKKTIFGKTIIIGAVFVLVLVTFYFGKLSFLDNPLQFAGNFLWKTENSALELFEDTFNFCRLQKDLIQENKDLKNQNWEIKLKLSNKQLLLAENTQLKELLGRKTENNSKTILANVISKPPLSMYNSLFADVGENYKIKKGAKVLAGDNLIGTVEDVYLKSSKIKLYSFPKDKIDVAVGFNKILTQAEGKGDGVFEIRLPQGIEIKIGDSVFLPDTDLFILGGVEKITSSPENPFQIILFKSAVNIFELRWVQILQE